MKKDNPGYLEIIFDKENPKDSKSPIRFKIRPHEIFEQLEYKFLIGKGGIWTVIREFSNDEQCVWRPKEDGKYIFMVQAKRKNKKTKAFEYVARENFEVKDGEIRAACAASIAVEEKKEEIQENNQEIKNNISVAKKQSQADGKNRKPAAKKQNKSGNVKIFKESEPEVKKDKNSAAYNKAVSRKNAKQTDAESKKSFEEEIINKAREEAAFTYENSASEKEKNNINSVKKKQIPYEKEEDGYAQFVKKLEKRGMSREIKVPPSLKEMSDEYIDDDFDDDEITTVSKELENSREKSVKNEQKLYKKESQKEPDKINNKNTGLVKKEDNKKPEQKENDLEDNNLKNNDLKEKITERPEEPSAVYEQVEKLMEEYKKKIATLISTNKDTADNSHESRKESIAENKIKKENSKNKPCAVNKTCETYRDSFEEEYEETVEKVSSEILEENKSMDDSIKSNQYKAAEEKKIKDKSSEIYEDYSKKDILKSSDIKASDYEEEYEEFEEENTDDSFDDESNEIIDDIILSKTSIKVGEKLHLEVVPLKNKKYLYRFFVKNKREEWSLIKDYEADRSLTYTAIKPGKMEILVQCKKLNSKEIVDDFRTVKIRVEDIGKIEIQDIKCLTDNLYPGGQLSFKVIANRPQKKGSPLLYKFIRITEAGKSRCLQDYSTINTISISESCPGEYRLLCLVRDMLSAKEYDDRAVMVYNINKFKKACIENFQSDFPSPQLTGASIRFKAGGEGAQNILYRFKIEGPVDYEISYGAENEFEWIPEVPGSYKIYAYIKEEDSDKPYDAVKELDFQIDERSGKPVKVTNIKVDNYRKILVGEPTAVRVEAEGGTTLFYAFEMYKDGRRIKKTEYDQKNYIDYIPEEPGEYSVRAMVKDRYSQKDYDGDISVKFRAAAYIPVEISHILFPYKDKYMVGDSIEFECMSHNPQEMLTKFKLKINGREVKETEYTAGRKFKIIPKTAGKYVIEAYAKNRKCKEGYDSKKHVSFYINAALPVLDTKIIAAKKYGRVNEEFKINVTCKGGKDVCCEFYLMEKDVWRKVQPYSRKNYFSFIPREKGNYNIMVMTKSFYSRESYEDYDEITIEVK